MVTNRFLSARKLTLEAVRIRGGFVGARKVKKAVVRIVIADVIERMVDLYISEVVPRPRTYISAEVGDEAEAYLGEALRASLARIAERFPTEN